MVLQNASPLTPCFAKIVIISSLMVWCSTWTADNKMRKQINFTSVITRHRKNNMRTIQPKRWCIICTVGLFWIQIGSFTLLFRLFFKHYIFWFFFYMINFLFITGEEASCLSYYLTNEMLGHFQEKNIIYVMMQLTRTF